LSSGIAARSRGREFIADEKRLGGFRKVRDDLRAYLKKFPQND
jgi:hypothetical protein